MKKHIALLLAMLITVSFVACGKSKAAEEVDKLIAAIGEVTLDSGDAIAEAEKAAAALESKDRETLENGDLLTASRAKYDRLVEEEKHRKEEEERKKEEEERKKEEERILNLVTNGSWFGIFAGDEYSFNTDGTGTHDKITLKYSISDGVINITEGAAGTIKTKLIIDESDDHAKLLTDDSDNYYVDQATYEEISAAIRAEYTAELIGHEAWAVHNGAAFMMYYMFNDKGGGWAVLYAGTYSLKWEFVDNDTIKITIITDREQSATYDIIVENHSYKLIQTNNSAIIATPHN